MCPRAHVDVHLLTCGLPGASSVPPWCLLGASSVPPRCLPGASPHPLTWSQGLFWTPKSPRILIPSQLVRNLGHLCANLGELATKLNPTRANFEQLGPISDQFCFNNCYLNFKIGVGHMKNHCFSIDFCAFFRCRPSCNLGPT